MTTVVISQPMLFPWVGMFEQIRLADVYVHYDDVPFSKGSFTNRVQLCTAQGPAWMTIPLEGLYFGQLIRDIRANEAMGWRDRHRRLLERSYATAPYRDEMMAIVEAVYAEHGLSLCELIMLSMESVRRYFNLQPGQKVLRSTENLAVPGRGSDRVLAIVKALGGTRYVTGHGARNYLQHDHFDAAGIDVAYMAYERRPYPQRYAPFNPHVSILDLIANVGKSGISWICSGAMPWKDFING